MKIIKILCEKIECELEDAHEYAELALRCRESCPETAALFCKLSSDEIAHMEVLHKEIVRHMDAYRQKKGEIPADMKAVYDYLHERQIKKAQAVNVLQCMFKR